MRSIDSQKKREILNVFLVISAILLILTIIDYDNNYYESIEQLRADNLLNISPSSHFSDQDVMEVATWFNHKYNRTYLVGSILPTGSMRPTIDEGHNSLWVKVDSIDDLEIGDVIIFSTDSEHERIIHRIIEMNSTTIITKGDNNLPRDNYELRFEDVLGKVVGILY